MNVLVKVIGLISESDLLAKLALGGGEDEMPGLINGILRQHETEKARAITAGDLMTSPAVTVSPDDSIEHAARLTCTRRVKRLPVTDESGHLAGIISRADVLTVYGRPDVEIVKKIRREVLLAPADPGTLDVSVTDGVVTLTGQPQNLGQGHDMVRRVRHVQGVVAVRDRFDYPAAGPEPLNVLVRFPVD